MPTVPTIEVGTMNSVQTFSAAQCCETFMQILALSKGGIRNKTLGCRYISQSNYVNL